MQDGQMLFDSTINWNKKELLIDETLGKLFRVSHLYVNSLAGYFSIR